MSSKIKVDTIENVAGSGNVSLGSGHNLVVPGNVTGQGTLAITGATTATGGVTIPASTTVGLNLGSGTNLAQLAMQSGVSNRVALRTTHTSTGDNNPFIINQPSSAGVQNDALVINTGGQVTKSKQPAFSAYEPNNDQTGVITFNNVTTNIGNHYDGSTGRFTAPVAGTYYFNFHAMCGSLGTGQDARGRFLINGSVHPSGEHYGGVFYADGAPYVQVTMATVLSLSANDHVSVEWQSGNNNMHQDHNMFCGFLIG